MKIEYSKENSVLVRDLFKGECFKYNDTLYLKTDNANYNSINLSTGELVCITLSREVVKIDNVKVVVYG